VTHIAETSTLLRAPQEQPSALQEAIKILAITRTETPITSSQGGEIFGHGLPFLRDPFTKTDLENESVFILVVTFIYVVGCGNNYAQFALSFEKHYDAANPFIRQTLEFLDRSHEAYYRIRGMLREVEIQKPEVIQRLPLYQQAIATDRRLRLRACPESLVVRGAAP
jgi:hypothetical protein